MSNVTNSNPYNSYAIQRTSSTSTHAGTSSSLMNNMHLASRDNEIATATENILHMLGNAFGKLTGRFSDWWNGTSWKDRKITKLTDTIHSARKEAFETKIQQELASRNWNPRMQKKLVEYIKLYLNLFIHREEASQETAKMWVGRKLQSLSAEQQEEIKRNVGMSDEVDSVPVFSEKQAIVSGGQLVDSTLCVIGQDAGFFGTTGNGTFQANIFALENDVVTYNPVVSQYISQNVSQYNSGSFIGNRTSSACNTGRYIVITDSLSTNLTSTTFYHSTFNNNLDTTGNLPQVPVPQSPWALRPVTLSSNYEAIAPSNGTECLEFVSTLTSFLRVEFNTSCPPPAGSGANPSPQELLTFADGSLHILQRNSSGLYSFLSNINVVGEVGFSSVVDTQLSGEILNQTLIAPYGIKTPLAVDTLFTTLFGKLINGSDVLHTYDTQTRTIVSSRVLPGGLADAKLSIANCQNASNIHVYARDNQENAEYTIRFDVVDANSNSDSLFNGEQIYNNFTISTPANPQIGCFLNDTGVLTFLEDGNPHYVTFAIPSVPPASPVSTPISGPTTPQAAPGIQVSIPPSLGPTPIPLTQVIIISGNITTITIVDPQGFNIIFNNGTTVPINTPIPVQDLPTISISIGSATPGSSPVFEGCDQNNQCVESITLEGLFSSPGVDKKTIIIPTAIGGLVLVVVGGTLFYVFKYRPLQKSRIERYENTPVYKPNQEV